jgi:hypothetical protein
MRPPTPQTMMPNDTSFAPLTGMFHRGDAGHEKKSIFAKISTCKYSILLRLILEFSSFFEFFLMTAEGAERIL